VSLLNNAVRRMSAINLSVAATVLSRLLVIADEN
jgi:hypothetical protein